ncbi:MAG TPA: O-antigen ligase family protein, partial [Opitutus sp.]|nr:O-antigen ligase family protein [Opitutus sp.]
PKRAQPLHPLETVLLCMAGAQLVFLPWALGGMRPWAQIPSFALAALAFLVALLPRTYSEDLTGGSRVRLYPAARLLRFPFFWLGLVYFAIVAIQIANPAWVYVEKNGAWWMEPLDFIEWLPRGVADTPFRMMNAGRTLLIHGAVWLLVCGLWVGLTRRKSARVLLLTIALNGFALAVVAVFQRLTGTKLMLWHWTPPAEYFVASFVYKNHAGAFFLLILALVAGFAWWHADRAREQLKKSHPGPVFALLTCLVAFALLLTYARATTALGLLALLVFGLGYLVHQSFASRGGSPPLLNVAVAVLMAGFLGVCLYLINTDRAWQRFDRLFKQDRYTSITFRQLAARATWDMALDSPAVGHGGGSFRFLFPRYQQAYPDIYMQKAWVNKKQVDRRVYWEHAHNDWVEFLAEFGLVGAGWLLAGFAVVVVAIRRSRAFVQRSRAVMLTGPLLVAIAAAADFPFHNPAVLTTAAAIVALTLRWSFLERRSA